MSDKKLRIGIAGMVNDHIWFMADATNGLPNAELVAAAEPHEELLAKAAARYGITKHLCLL